LISTVTAMPGDRFTTLSPTWTAERSGFTRDE